MAGKGKMPVEPLKLPRGKLPPNKPVKEAKPEKLPMPIAKIVKQRQ